MFDFDLIRRAPWHDLVSLFTSGSPPLMYQLMALNTVFFMAYCFSRARAKHPMRGNSVFAVQFLLIGVNSAVLLQQQFGWSTMWLNDARQSVQVFLGGLI